MDSGVASNVKSGSMFNADGFIYGFTMDSGVDLDIDRFWSRFEGLKRGMKGPRRENNL